MKKATMPTFSPKNTSRYGIRSISLPARSHPSTVRIVEELNKLRSWEVSSSSKVETICSGLSGLVELYKCIEDLLKLSLTQQALAQHQNEKWVDELLDCPVRFLDILGNTRDAISLLKGSVGELQSAIRRRKVGDLSIENHVSAYFSLRRSMRKKCTKPLLILKQMDASSEASPPLDLNNHVSAVLRVLREASLITSSVFQSLLLFLSSPPLKSKLSKWTIVSRLVQKGVLVCSNQHESVNELEKVDFALDTLVMNDSGKVVEVDKIDSAQRRLRGLVVGIEGIENGLEFLFRHLINTRVSFLNILSP